MISRSTMLNQQQLNVLSGKIMEKFDSLTQCLGISLDKGKNKYTGACPVHGGDKFNALNLYHSGDSYIGNWKCRTNGCEKHFKSSIIGFVRGVLSHKKYNWTGPGDNQVSFKETLDYISSCLKEDYSNIEIDYELLEKNQFVKQVGIIQRKINKSPSNLTREKVRANLIIPSEYFIKRGFTSAILDKYDVGLNNNSYDVDYDRITVPIYDDDHKFVIASTSRSVFEKCPDCGTWHSPKIKCPHNEYAWKFSKWKHTAGFPRDKHCYNFWYAQEYIKQSKVAIITESPGNVWRLEEAGIHTGLATYGATISDGQIDVINRTGALTLLVIMDNDDAGKRCAEEIKQCLSNTYKIEIYTPSKNDIAEMSIEEVRNEILPIYKNLVLEWELVCQ